MICLGFTRICREIVDVAIYALYPESFCSGNLAIRKVFAFSDSGFTMMIHTEKRYNDKDDDLKVFAEDNQAWSAKPKIAKKKQFSLEVKILSRS